jgi:hypothetical protein
MRDPFRCDYINFHAFASERKKEENLDQKLKGGCRDCGGGVGLEGPYY